MPSAFADDGIELPVTEARTVFDDAGAFLDRDPITQVAAAVIGSVPFLAGLLAAEMSVKGAILGLIVKNMLIDPFVTNGDGLSGRWNSGAHWRSVAGPMGRPPGYGFRLAV